MRFGFIFSSFILRNNQLQYLLDQIISLFNRWTKSIGYRFIWYKKNNGQNQQYHNEARYLLVSIQINLSLVDLLFVFRECNRRHSVLEETTIYYWLFNFKIYHNWSTFSANGLWNSLEFELDNSFLSHLFFYCKNRIDNLKLLILE